MNHSAGDARKLLGLLELAFQSDQECVDEEFFKQFIESKGIAMNQDQHYDLVSAFIKSMRGSDVNATLYWLARLLKGGEDPRYIARRMVIFASEDIGIANSQALVVAQACFDTTEKIGMPEVQINLGHVACFLATCDKSNQTYLAIKKAETVNR